MRRAASILIGIILGALASGLGIGLVLHQANADRIRLAGQIEDSHREAAAAREQSRRTVEAANQQLQAANAEISQAQQLIKNLNQEHDLISHAQTLRPIKGNLPYGWNDVIGLELGVSLKQPPGSLIATNSSRALTLMRDTAAGDPDPRWLSLTRYDAQTEQELAATFTTSTTVSYLVNDHLLTGLRGWTNGQRQPVLLLRVQKSGLVSYLLWARDPFGSPDISATLVTVLSSLAFEH